MTNLLTFIGLTLGIAPAVLAVFVFYKLSMGVMIVPDNANLLELQIASLILTILLVAWASFIIKIVMEVRK